MNTLLKRNIQIVNNGDSGFTILFEESASRQLSTRLNHLSSILRKRFEDKLVEIIPAYTSLTLVFKLEFLINNEVDKFLEALTSELDWESVKPPPERLIEIPVCYEEAFAPDHSKHY